MRVDFRDRPIPLHAHPSTALDYENVPVDLNDPRSGEALVDLTEYGVAGSGYYARTDGLNPPYYGRLASASERPAEVCMVRPSRAEVINILTRNALDLI